MLLRLCGSSLIVLFDDVHFNLLLAGNSSIFLEVESMKPVQMFFEDSVASDVFTQNISELATLQVVMS